MAKDNKPVTDVDDSGYTTVLAKLVKNLGFARGDFLIMQGNAIGVEVTNIAISDADVADKGKYHRPGELFHISNFPTRSSIVESPVRLNRPTIKGKMAATLILTKNDEVTDTASSSAGDLGAILKGGVSSVLTKVKNAGTSCKLAPRNLKEAVARHKSVEGGYPGSKYKSLPPNGEIVSDKNGKKTFLGLHTVYDNAGNMTISANNKGLKVDNEGNLVATGNVSFQEAPAEPHGLIGMPTKKNGLRDINPGTLFYPVGMGPLALNKIPDLSMLNWALKTLAVVDIVKEIGQLVDEKQKSGKRLSQLVEERQTQYEKDRNNSVKGKIQ